MSIVSNSKDNHLQYIRDTVHFVDLVWLMTSSTPITRLTLCRSGEGDGVRQWSGGVDLTVPAVQDHQRSALLTGGQATDGVGRALKVSRLKGPVCVPITDTEHSITRIKEQRVCDVWFIPH